MDDKPGLSGWVYYSIITPFKLYKHSDMLVFQNGWILSMNMNQLIIICDYIMNYYETVLQVKLGHDHQV